MVQPVTDPKLLAQLEGGSEGPSAAATAIVATPTTPGQPVSDVRLLAQLEGGGEAPAGQKPLESVIPHMIDRAKQGAANLLGLAGAPVSAVNQLGRALGTPVSDSPVGGLTQVTRGWEEILGVKHIKAPTDAYDHPSKANEYLGTISEFLGGAVLPGAGAVAQASRKLLTAVTVMLGNTSAATFSVEAKEAGGNLAPSFGLTKEQGEQVGAMAGGFAGSGLVSAAGQAIAKSTAMGVKAAASVGVTGFSADAQKVAASGLMQKEILDSLKHAPQSAANVARAAQLKAKIDRFAPNLAQSTDAPGLKAGYREIANKSPEALAKATENHQKNLAAIEAYKTKAFGEKPSLEKPAIQGLTDPARIKLEADRSVFDMATAKNERDLRTLSDKFRRNVDNEAVGEELRTKYWEARSTAQAANQKQLAGVYATAKRYGITDDMTDIRDSVNRIMTADRSTFQDMPPTFAKVLNEYPAGTPAKMERKAVQTGAGTIYRTETTPGKPGQSTASFEELHSLYKQANKDWADSVISGNSTRAFYMKGLRDQLQEKVNKYHDPQYGELAKKFSDFNQNYTRYARTFKEGAGGEIAKRTKGGIATDAEDIIRKTILGAGDKKRGIQDFFDIYGKDERAAELLHDGLLDNYSKAAMKSGTFNPIAARNWLAQHHQAMSELPETAKIFGNAEKTAAAMVNRRLELQQQRKVLDMSTLAKVAQNEQPEQLIQRAIGDPKIMRAVLEGAYTNESKQAIARAVADNISKRAEGHEFLIANAASLKPVMERLRPGHWQNLLDIAEAEKISKRVAPPTAVELGKIQDIGEQYIGTSVKGMFSRLRNLDKPMGVSKSYLIMDVGGRFIYKTRSEELAKLREAAYLDPEAGEVLAKLVMKTNYTRQDLLNLQAISYAAGVNSTAQAIGVSEGKNN